MMIYRVVSLDSILKDKFENRRRFNLVLRNSINCKRRAGFEISNIETIWSEITLPNSKPFLICTA